jgi:hypothetical protein
MRIMLTSFGLGHEYLPETPSIPPFFHRLPPLDMRSVVGPFEPEYSLLVLCDKLILDELSFERLERNSSPLFTTMGKTVKVLYDEGFVELADYSATLRNNMDLLGKMTDSDLVSGRWEAALSSSNAIWRNYFRKVAPRLGLEEYAGRETRGFVHLPRAGEIGPAFRTSPHIIDGIVFRAQEFYDPGKLDFPRVRDLIAAYLVYVNANLILSNEMDSALHDWEDFSPFYRQKFLGVGQRNPPATAQADASRQLFDIALPELAIDSPEHLVRVLKHRHVQELRALIDAASRGDVEFDVDFARNVFREVFGIERKAAKGRRIIGYVTMPLGFIPLIGNFAQAAVQEAAGTVLERRLRKPYRWLYMLTDLADPPTRKAL